VVSFPLWDDVAKNLQKRRGTTIVYDCHDLLEGFNNINDEIVQKEAELMRAADLVVFSSEWLAREHINRMPEIEAKSTVIRNAVDPRSFNVCPSDNSGPRTIGYAGALNFWFDIEAVKFAAKSHPEWRFLLIGSVAPSFPKETLKPFPNIQLVGEVPYEDLPRWFAEFDVAMIPFLVQPLILATNPIKLYEYLACGFPIVGPMIPELARYSELLYLASDSHDFCRQIELAVAENNQSLRSERRRIAQLETWQNRCELLTRELHRVVPDVTARVT
jgi:glycosyltransferase involved in cell wall biosynthesis